MIELDKHPKRHLAWIRINSPKARNAIDGDAALGIESALDDDEADQSVWATILAEAPPVDCAGADLWAIRNGRKAAYIDPRLPTEEFGEGSAAFVEQRAPCWVGR